MAEADVWAPTYDFYGKRESNQVGIVYDLLSEGPIEGLVDGASSVYLDGVPIQAEGEGRASNSLTTTGSISASSTTLNITGEGGLKQLVLESEGTDR